MTLLLTLVHAPRAQAIRQMRLDEGALVIGRGADADWRIEDPDMFVSRAHCTVSAQGGAFTVTDTSSGGLFVDDGRAPLGPGRSAPLRDGMRLRLGDYVVRVEVRAAGDPPPPTPRAGQARSEEKEFDADGFFSTPVPERPRVERPRDLPDPFERPGSFVPPADTAPPERKRPPEFDDPFTLDPPSNAPAPRAGSFDWGPASPAPPESPAGAPAGTSWKDADAGWGEPRGTSGGPTDVWSAPPEPAPAETKPPPPSRPAPTAPRGGGDDALLQAFLRGLGLDAADAPSGGDPVARMEALGKEYRLMVEGLMHLLRKRAEEKGNARIARTVVGSAEVNPLKFMPTVEDALAVMVGPRSGGFADAEGAIAGAIRDLATHHVATWRGTQAALARMIDRFDPKTLEKELEALGLLEKLLAGGRRAKLWELYQKRFGEIARSAETRFLGEVGADFREAYETED